MATPTPKGELAMNYKAELIKTNNQLIIELQNQITLLKLVMDISTKATNKIVGKELDGKIAEIEARIEKLRNRKFTTLKEER